LAQNRIEELAELIALLPPVPGGWIEAAQELAPARAALDALVERAEQDAELRAQVLADLERALAEHDVEPTPRVVEEARRRLSS